MLSLLGIIPLAAQTVTLVPAQAHSTPPQPPAIQCETGPARRSFGGSQWLVYSCNDQASMVVVSMPDSPAASFVFFLKPEDGTYSVSGEGNGDKKAVDAAGAAISRMTSAEFAALLAATKAGQP